MNLPITDNDLDTIVKALALGGDTRLYFLLKNLREDKRIEEQNKYGECDI